MKLVNGATCGIDSKKQVDEQVQEVVTPGSGNLLVHTHM
jgi:hypothetical protein